MNRAWSVSAVVLALAALALRFSSNGGAPGTSNGPGAEAGTSSQVAARQTNPTNAGSDESPKQPEIDGPWLATRRFYQSPVQPAIPTLPSSNKPLDFTNTAQIQKCTGDC